MTTKLDNQKEINNIRKQLTLFLQDNYETIEKIRQKFNPKQYELIKAHVTLCREDEIENLEQVLNNLSSLNEQKITIRFEKPTRFDNGKGVFLKAHSDLKEFESLRRKILQGTTNQPREQMPHITLMHPRNSTCNNEIFDQINQEIFPSIITFNKISLIEKRNDSGWKVLKNFSLI